MKIPLGNTAKLGAGLIVLRESVAIKILTTVEAGWRLASSRVDVHAGCYEVDITERLRDGMRLALASTEQPGQRTLTVLPGTESRSSPDVLRPNGRTDIPIMVTEVFQEHGNHDRHAVVECKRLAGVDSNLCREYVVNGIDRFTRGKYGRSHQTGFMVGYLISGKAVHSVDGVNRYLTNKGRNTERLSASKLVSACWAWTSTHPRSRDTVGIDLHHAHLRLPQGSRSGTSQLPQVACLPGEMP